MANFSELKNIQYLPTDGDWYKVSGVLTEEDIKKINLLPRKTILVIENTNGLTSELISKITSDNIMFSVTGGLDHFNRDKYKKADYVKRTLMSPKGLTKVIEYYEEIESYMKPEWTDTQKCMFLYDCLTKDFKYEENYQTPLEIGTVERTLNGILYKKLVCSGFATVFKEGLDRLNINNIYQNRATHHSWNLVELDGKLRGIELTWECNNKGNDGFHNFGYFGRDPEFYENKHHKFEEVIKISDLESFEDIEKATSEVYYEGGEQKYDLSVFTPVEISRNYQVIESTIEQRQTNNKVEFQNEEQLIQYLPIDRLRVKIQKQSKDEYNYQMLYNFLKINGILSEKIDNQLSSVFNNRKGFLFDVINTSQIDSFNARTLGIIDEKLNKCHFYKNGDYSTPFGEKRKEINEEIIIDQNHKKEVFEILTKRLLEYTANYLVDLLNNTEKLIAEYDKTTNLTDNPDLNISMKEADLYTKLNVLLNSRELCASFNIPQDLFDKKIEMIEKYLNSKNRKLTEEEKKERSVDFLYEAFSDEKEIRNICEQHEGHSLTDEEWYQKRTDVNYIMTIFDKLKEFNIKEEYIQEVLNNIYSENKNTVRR